MIGKISAIIASAGCAAVFVVSVPGFAPSVAAHAVQPPAVTQTMSAQTVAVQAPVSAATLRRPSCTESWPYYEPACLYDARQPDGRARIVRIVSVERAAVPASASRPGAR
jgi:hypothetical protein